jgi:enoyl-CoA hydratase/carnithine racemase
MTAHVHYQIRDGIAEIRIDDGKVNALTQERFAELGAAFDRAKADRAVVVLTGRSGVFSAGFDLRVLRAGGRAANETVRAGFELAERILAFPAPVVIACTGHAIAMGVFLVLAGDYRIGARGEFQIGANEVAIGITMPRFGVEMCRQRLAPAHFQRAVALAEMYAPDDAVAAGFLDRVVPAADLERTAREVAERLAKLPVDVHAASKLRAREQALAAVRTATLADTAGALGS